MGRRELTLRASQRSARSRDHMLHAGPLPKTGTSTLTAPLRGGDRLRSYLTDGETEAYNPAQATQLVSGGDRFKSSAEPVLSGSWARCGQGGNGGHCSEAPRYVPQDPRMLGGYTPRTTGTILWPLQSASQNHRPIPLPAWTSTSQRRVPGCDVSCPKINGEAGPAVDKHVWKMLPTKLSLGELQACQHFKGSEKSCMKKTVWPWPVWLS